MFYATNFLIMKESLEKQITGTKCSALYISTGNANQTTTLSINRELDEYILRRIDRIE